MKKHDKLSSQNNETVNVNNPVSDAEIDNETAFDKPMSSNALQNKIADDLAQTQDDLIDSNSEQSDENIDKKLNKKAKKSKDKNKQAKPKQPWYKQLIPLSIVMVVGIISGAILGTWYYKSSQINVDYSGYKEEELRDDTMAILQEMIGKTNPSQQELDNWVNLAKQKDFAPDDLPASKNILLAEYNASKAKSFQALGSGKVATITTQTIYSNKSFDGNAYSFESISKGTLTIADCYYMKNTPNPTVSVIKGTKIQPTSAVWNGAKTDYTRDEFKKLAGSLPSSLNPYIISTKTVLNNNVSYEVSTSEEGKKLYTFTIQLDPIASVINYVKQVKMTSGLSGYPAFDDITITYTIDEDWNLVTTDILEHYVVFYIAKAPCTGTLKTDYKFNIDVKLPEILA